MRTTRPRRRSLAVAAVLAATALVAVGCGDDTTKGGSTGSANGGVTTDALPTCPVDAFKKASTPTEVVVWHSFVGRTAATLQKIADAYNASNPKVKVRLENQGANYEELRQKYEQAMGAKQLPAIVAGEDTWTQFMIDNGTTLPAQSCIKADKDPRAKMDDLLPAVKAFYTVDGVQWPAAFGTSTLVMYFNKNAFTAAGLDPTKPPTNYTELRAAAEKLKAAGQGAKGPLVMKMDPWFFQTAMTGNGSTVVDHDNGRDGSRAAKGTVDSKDGKAFMDFIAGMAKDKLLNPVKRSALIDHYLALATQQSAMGFETSTAITLIAGVVQGGLDLKKELGDSVNVAIPADFKVPFEVGVAPVPGITKAGSGGVGGAGIYMTKTGSDAVQSAAWDFMKFFNQPDNQELWTREGSYLPNRDRVEKKLEADSTWSSSLVGQWIATAYQGMKNLNPKFPGPLIGPYDAFNVAVGDAMEKATITLGDPAEAIKEAQTNVDAAIKKYNDTNF